MRVSSGIVEAAARTLAGVGPAQLAATVGVATARTLAMTAPSGVIDASHAPAAGGDLEIARTLGEGGMGIVQLAKQRSLGREVAVKRVRDATDGGAVSALLAEATVTGGLEHPAIVPIHALVRDERGPMMVMKRLEGVTLRELIDDSTHARWSELSSDRLGFDRLGFFVGVVRRLCDALALAASRGVVHRDVKPENVMIGRFGEVYLLDWGIAVPAGQKLPGEAIAGTPVYMAPEMLRPASGEIDARSDVYLLGATLHECVTGAPPHRGETLLAVLASVAECAPISYGPEVPDALASLLRRAMSASREARFADARELGRALDTFVAHRAADDLCRAADGRRALLEDAITRGAPATEVHSLFHACRFGYEHALRDWPENEAARSGRDRAIERVARWALTTGDRATGKNLLAELPSPPADLVERLAELERDAASADAERARLKAALADHDLRIGANERAILVRAAAVVIALCVVTVLGLYFAGLFVPTATSVTIFTLPPLVAIAVVLVAWRDRLLVNRVSRQLAFTIVVLVLLVLVHRAIGAARGTPLAEVASGDAFVVSACAALSGLTLRRLYFVPALAFLAAGAVAPFLETLAFIPIFAAAVLSVVTIVISPRALSAPALGEAVTRDR